MSEQCEHVFELSYEEGEELFSELSEAPRCPWQSTCHGNYCAFHSHPSKTPDGEEVRLLQTVIDGDDSPLMSDLPGLMTATTIIEAKIDELQLSGLYNPRQEGGAPEDGSGSISFLNSTVRLAQVEFESGLTNFTATNTAFGCLRIWRNSTSVNLSDCVVGFLDIQDLKGGKKVFVDALLGPFHRVIRSDIHLSVKLPDRLTPGYWVGIPDSLSLDPGFRFERTNSFEAKHVNIESNPSLLVSDGGMYDRKRLGKSHESSLFFGPGTGTSDPHDFLPEDVVFFEILATKLRSGQLGQNSATTTYYDLASSELGDVSFSPGSMNGNTESERLGTIGTPPIPDRFNLIDTEFDAFPLIDNLDVLSSTGYAVHRFPPYGAGTSSIIDETALPRPIQTRFSAKKAQLLYLRLRRRADALLADEAASTFFIWEKRLQRIEHIERIRTQTFRGIVGGLKDYFANRALWYSSGFGERPLRPFSLAVLMIAAFTVIYNVLFRSLSLTPPYGGGLGYLTLSVEAFVTLVLGSSATYNNEVVRLVAATEAFFGAFIIALFVFTLTRSLKR